MTERRIVRLGDYVDLLTGFPFKSAEYSTDGSGIRLLRGDNIAQGVLRWGSAKRWPERLSSEYTSYQLREGDVVLAMDRPWIEAGLKHAAVSKNDLPSLLVQRVARLRALPGLEQTFLRYLIGGKAFTDHVLAVQTGTAVPHISGDQIRDFRFELPGTSEQIAIAEMLGALDDKMAANLQLSRLSWNLSAALYKRLISQAKREVPLGDVIDLAYGKALPARARVEGSVPVYGSGGVVGWHDVALVPGPGVVIGRKGTVGAVHWSHHAFYPIDTTFYVRPIQDLPLLFVYFVLESLDLQGMNFDSAVPGLNRNAALVREIPLPEARALQSFAELAAPLIDRVASALYENNVLARLRDVLLPWLLSGELRLREAEALVEENV